MDKLTYEQLQDLANFERDKMPDSENVWYIGYLWGILQDLSGEFAEYLQTDYKKYAKETEDA